MYAIRAVVTVLAVCAVGVLVADLVNVGLGVGLAATMGASAGRSGWWW